MENCAFCNIENEHPERVIFQNEIYLTLVSQPAWHRNHILVIPRRHIEKVGDLTDTESVAITREIGRLNDILDEGSGTGLMQKFQPKQAENDVKVNHLHFHVFPREHDEPNLFPVPAPNSFQGFYRVSDEEVSRLTKLLTRA